MEKHILHIVTSDRRHTRQYLSEARNNRRFGDTLKTGQLSLRLYNITSQYVTKNEIYHHHRAKDIERSYGKNDDHVSHEEEHEDESTVEIGWQVRIHRV